MKKWELKELPPVTEELEQWAEQLEISPFIAQLLIQRGHASFDTMQLFLSPNLRHLAPLAEWPGVMEAAELLTTGLLSGKKVAVWGDYDVDGVTSTALVVQVLQAHGFDVIAHIPERRNEGYGLNDEGLKNLADKGIELLITVDCGISDNAAITYANTLGIQVILTDHHLPAATLPPAAVIVNPCLHKCPCADLAGVGVAFFVMAAVNAKLSEKTGHKFDMRKVLDLVALGSLADVVKLVGQNRVLIKNGMLTVAEAKRIGLAALKSVSNFTPHANLGAGQIVFGLTPRINAAGRVGQAKDAFELLLLDNAQKAASLAQYLDSLNLQRRSEEERISVEAFAMLDAHKDSFGIVLCGEEWHPGVVGIVASRVVEKAYRPAILFCKEGDFYKGSGRSIPNFDLHAALTECEDLLLGFGGHKQAAGCRVAPDKFEAFSQKFNEVVARMLNHEEPLPLVTIDAAINFEALVDDSFMLVRELELMQPFGVGNPEPVFITKDLRVKSVRYFGAQKEHAEIYLAEDTSGVSLSAKIWRNAASVPKDMAGKRLDIAYAPRINAYNGVTSVEIRLKDWKFAE